MDASKHWNSRGGGYQSPMGYDVLSPSQGAPLAVLASPDAEWPVSQERAAGYAWKGYRLDAQRRPTFLYKWYDTPVEESYEVTGTASVVNKDPKAQPPQLVRKLKLQGAVPKNTFLRLALGKVEAKGDSFLVDAGKLDLEGRGFENKLLITAPGAKIIGQNLLLPVAGNEVTITYSWPQ